MKHFRNIALPLAALLVLGCFLYVQEGTSQAETAAPREDIQATGGAPEATEETLAREQLDIKTASGDVHRFNVELALTPEERIQGLMYRTELDDDGGMLFVFPVEQKLNFWMKNTYIPLDIVYIKRDGLIHHVHPDAVPEDLTPLPSNGPVSYVLEIKGGMAEALGIKPGDRVFNKNIFGNELAD